MANLKAVIGANYGDEGKGLMVNYFANEAKKRNESCLVVCTNGGAQRGHTVVHDGKKHVFHHFGSGTLAGAVTYLCEDFILNPLIFSEEYTELKELGIEPEVYASTKCKWTTPYDMIANQIIEESRGDKKHGSCGVGIWETMVRYKKQDRPLSIRQALYCGGYNRGRNYVLDIRDEYYPERLKEFGITEIPDKWKEIWFSDNLLNNFMEDLAFMTAEIYSAPEQIMREFDNVIFENGQGLLLDEDQHEENATPSQTGSDIPNWYVNRLFPKEKMEVCYVTRTYMTRHGAGEFPTECDVIDINPKICDKTNVENEFQGKLRYGKINLTELEERIVADVKKRERNKLSVAITHLNETDWRLHTTDGAIPVDEWGFDAKVYFSRREDVAYHANVDYPSYSNRKWK